MIEVRTLSVPCSGCLIDEPIYDDVVDSINVSAPKIVVALIRSCVTGCCDDGGYTVANPHPFYREKNGKTWTFAHNGVVSKARMYDLLGDYLKANPPNGSDIIPACDPSDLSLVVDTELYFLFVLKKVEENGWLAVNGIVEAVTEMMAAGATGAMNFIMSDGYTNWGFRKGYRLEYLDESSNGYSAVASQRPGSTGNWHVMSDYELVVLTHDSPSLIMDVRNLPQNYLADAGFNNSSVDVDLRTEGPGPDWYESLGDDIQAYSPKNSLTHISFATLGDGAGTFYMDNVMEASLKPPCRQDLNKDGQVGDFDLSLFSATFGQSGNGDFNFDCDVDGSDLVVLEAAFGNDCPKCKCQAQGA